MRRPIVALAAVAALLLVTPVTAQPFTDVTPANSGLILCPADLGGGGAALAWLRFGEAVGGRDTLALVAAGLDPATPPAALVPGGGCPAAAVAPSGASLVALTLSGLEEQGEVLVVDRAADGAASTPLRLNRNPRSEDATAALAGSGAALVAWRETTGGSPAGSGSVNSARVAARDAGGAFSPSTALDENAGRATVGIDEAGFGIAVWSAFVPGNRDRDASRLRFGTRAPGGAFTAPREIGTVVDGDSLSLVVGPAGEVLLAVSDDSGVRIASGTTRTGIGSLRSLYRGGTSGVTAAISANGAAAVAWLQARDEHAPRPGVAISDRPPGGDFGAPHPLAAPGTRLGGNDVRGLRLAAAPDGRVVATWVVEVSAGDRLTSPVPAASLRRADGRWEAAVPLAGPCRELMDAFPGFDAAGRPRVAFVDSAMVSGGDLGFPDDTRVRVARLDAAPQASSPPPPKVMLGAARRQVLRGEKVRLRVRCARDCDAMLFAVIRGYAGRSSGLFPQYRRLRAGRWAKVALDRESYFDDADSLDNEGRTVTVTVVAHACDSTGRMARARRTIRVRIPVSRKPFS